MHREVVMGDGSHGYPRVVVWGVTALLVPSGGVIAMTVFMAVWMVVLSPTYIVVAPFALVPGALMAILVRYMWKLREHFRTFRLRISSAGFQVGEGPVVPWSRVTESRHVRPIYASMAEMRVRYLDEAGGVQSLRFNSYIGGWRVAKQAFLGRGAAPTLKP